MITKNYLFIIIFIYSINFIYLIQCQITNAYDQLLSNELDYIEIKHIPSILHNDNVYLTILYKCSSLTKRRISLSIRIERTLYRTNFAVFRRHWFCQKSTHIQIKYLKVHLHRSLAYASDIQSNLSSWPIEQGQLKVIMYNNEQENENEILKKLEYNVRFLPVHQRPSIRTVRWNPFIYKKSDAICLKEPEIVRIINYPLVLTGGAQGKHFDLPRYDDYGLRFEQQMRITRPQFSILFWLYIDEYCVHPSPGISCAILQHLTFNNTQLTPKILLSREGNIMVFMYGYLYDLQGTGAQTIAKIPKKDWCRVVFVVNESNWNMYINCLQTWDKPIKAVQNSPIYYYSNDEFGTFVVGGSDSIPSFRGFISQMDVYRRTALTYEQLPNRFDRLLIPYLPSRIQESNQCKHYLNLYRQCDEQFHLFNKRIQQKFTCNAQPFLLNKSNQQCSIIPTWKKRLSSSTTDVQYRIFRALRQRKMNSTKDVANKLFDLTIKLLEHDDFALSCDRILTWSEQAMCYGHPSAHSLLATLYQFGLCGLQPNSSRALELLLSGVLHNDRISLLALGHRHFYGLDGIPHDYDTAYVYYQQMAYISKDELYKPKPGEAAMEHIRLTENKVLDELTFDRSDSFHWLKQQARLGVAAAQHRLGALLHAGGNGLTRNIQAAVEYFRLGAIQHDASSHFGYGLALLTGQGTKQNITEAIRHIEKAVEHGFIAAQVTLGYHAYEIEKNYTKAAFYWKDCFDRVQDANCAHNLGVMWSAGHYPPSFTVDHVQAWQYYSFAAQHGQIDSKILVAFYNARGGHPSIIRNSGIAASWSRSAAEDSSAVGTIAQRALRAYRDGRWHTSFIFYLQTALAGIHIGYFNGGYLCNELEELNNKSSFNCIEDLFNMYLKIHAKDTNIDSYALLTVAEYYQSKKRNITKVIDLYSQLYENGDPQGLYNLAQLEEEGEGESNSNETIPLDVWAKVGIVLDENSITNRYRRIQSVYQHCRTLQTPRSDESYIPCTLAYLKISTLILFDEQSKLFITAILLIITTSIFLIQL